MSTKTKIIKINYVKLGRHKSWGFSEGNGEILIDPRLKGKKLLEIIIHEMVHELWPEIEEPEVEKKAATIARSLWKEGYRKVDNHEKDKMQDETKEFI